MKKKASRDLPAHAKRNGLSLTPHPLDGFPRGVVVSLAGGVDALDRRDLDAGLLRLIREENLFFAVDLAGIDVVSEKGLVLALVEAAAHLRSRDGFLVLFGLHRSLRRAFADLYRSDELPLFSTESKARKGLAAERERIAATPLSQRIRGFSAMIEGPVVMSVARAQSVDRAALVKCTGTLTEQATTPFWYNLDRVAEHGFTRLVLDCAGLEAQSIHGAGEFCKSFMLNYGGRVAIYGCDAMARLLAADCAMPGSNSFWCDDEETAMNVLLRQEGEAPSGHAEARPAFCPKCGRKIESPRLGISVCSGCGAKVLIDIFSEIHALPISAAL